MLTGQMLRDAILLAAQEVTTHRQEIDALNVFPVPDGDTGTNMAMTLQAAGTELAALPASSPVCEVASVAAQAMLRGARGNSGVILSLIFRGIDKQLRDSQTADGQQLAAALQRGAQAAYKAVMKPTEGTILTVIRRAGEEAGKAAGKNNDVHYVLQQALGGARETLAQTPQMLPVLKRAGVVDAGGQGLVYILQAMYAVISGESVVPQVQTQTTPAVTQQVQQEISFTYCTEMLLRREGKRSPEKLRAYLESIGDSLVFVEDDELLKVHVHTNEPGNVLQQGLQYGTLTSVKVENMREQLAHTAWGAVLQEPPQKEEPAQAIGLVAVASGDGLRDLFMELGADAVVSGGQSMNPSTQEILQAVQEVPAQHVFVLPNNKNIIMAAQQVLRFSDKTVTVIPTKTIAQGIAAALALDPENALRSEAEMLQAAKQVKTGMVTFAARDSETFHRGDILGICEGEIRLTRPGVDETAFALVQEMFDPQTNSTVTLLAGADVTPAQAQVLQKTLRARLGDTAEVALVMGGQPLYYYIIGIE